MKGSRPLLGRRFKIRGDLGARERQEGQPQGFASWLPPQGPLELEGTSMAGVLTTLRGQIQS